MSQSKITQRNTLIINKLRKQKQATFNEICDYLKRESDVQGVDLTISKRTFNRRCYRNWRGVRHLHQI